MARLILWRGKTPTLIATLTVIVIAQFHHSWSLWAVILTALVAGSSLAIFLVQNSKRADEVEQLLAQLMRANHRMNAEIERRTKIEAELAAARDEALEMARLQ